MNTEEHPISYDFMELMEDRGSGTLNLGLMGLKGAGLHGNQKVQEK